MLGSAGDAGWQLPFAGAVETLASGGTIMSSLEDAIKVSAALRGQKKYIEAIDLVQRALAAAPAESQGSAGRCATGTPKALA